MSYRGTVKSNGIALDEPLPFAEGTRVEVIVEPEKERRKGSPQAILELAGSLTDEEAETLERAARECRRIDWSMWR
jgi:hypothetical protein